MRTRYAGNSQTKRPAGFTLVELLVVITIIGMLMALLLPAVGAARARARMGECLNNLKNVGQAMVAYQTSKGELPGYVQPLPRSGTPKSWLTIIEGPNGGGMNDFRYTSTTDRTRSRISWMAMLLPHIEGQDTYDRMTDSSFTDAGTGTAINPVSPFTVFICPADSNLLADNKNAGATYVANTGSWDLNGSGSLVLKTNTAGDIKENGLLFNLTVPGMGEVRQRMSSVRDSASTTLMLSENIQKDDHYCWMGVDNDSSTLYGEQQLGFVWVASLDPQNEGASSGLQQLGISQEDTSQPGVFTPSQPKYARPGSSHPANVVNAVMADGSAKSINKDIDYTVYQALMTAEGRACVYPPDHTAKLGSGDAIYTFRRLPPIADKDFQ
ncbi:Fimbrial protein precursor [Pirellulimonas nuda]|uniref:Fimbrial protein n=1 Tax=Pirellulimonas nuda TaxID=2528009 RepID=A0A518DIE3_9BACT|nr:DUF1559 domain-containing protein [Pirellulimonas nuda]QDU91248.1 Fimbrial protein precursor [Pirellulimonas nuda]